jgi:hypothetical protein
MLDPDIIAMGIVRGKHVLLICNQAGVNKLPDPVRIEKGEWPETWKNVTRKNMPEEEFKT